jgi:hypothetical protein
MRARCGTSRTLTSGGSTDTRAKTLAAILEEVRRAVLAVDEDTGEHRPVRDIMLDTVGAADTVAER